MDPSSLVPTPDQIPAPWWVFELLGGVTLALHLLVMNTVVGGSLINVWRRLVRKTQDTELITEYTKTTPVMLAIGINLGVAPLLFVQVTYGHLMYSSSILMATFWLGIIPMLIVAYYSTYVARGAQNGRLRDLAAALSVMLFLWIAFVFANNMSLMVRPDRWTVWFDNRDGTILNLGDWSLYPRYLHFLAASVAVGGMFYAIMAWWKNPARKGRYLTKQDDGGAAVENTASGLRIFTVASLVQVAVGIWYLLVLPRPVMLTFMGHNAAATIALLAGIGSATVAIIFGWRNRLWPAVASLVATVAIMVVIRSFARFAYLDGIFDPAINLRQHYEAAPLFAFLITFVAGLAVMAWLVSKATTSGKVKR